MNEKAARARARAKKKRERESNGARVRERKHARPMEGKRWHESGTKVAEREIVKAYFLLFEYAHRKFRCCTQ